MRLKTNSIDIMATDLEKLRKSLVQLFLFRFPTRFVRFLQVSVDEESTEQNSKCQIDKEAQSQISVRHVTMISIYVFNFGRV